MNTKFSQIDLHLHTTSSDGEDSPKQLLQNIINSNVKFFSISDHNTLKGVINFLTDENINILKDNGINFVTGTEISSSCNNHWIHLLGFDYKIDNSVINSLIDDAEKMKKRETQLRIEYIAEKMNINLSEQSIEYLNSLNVCAKPHFAKVFVQEGYADNIIDALKTMASKLPSYCSDKDAGIVIPAILESDGIPVWAHPLGGINEKRLTKEDFLDTLNKLISYGLKGLECYYSLYTKDEIEFLVKTAKEKNLLISAGSDYHGKNVKKVKIGEIASENFDIDADNITIIKNFKNTF